MNVYLDTSALYAFICRTDQDHERIKQCIQKLLDDNAAMFTSSYVLSETMCLVQHRLGISVLKEAVKILIPALEIIWINEDIHNRACSWLFEHPKQSTNIVDAASFLVAREFGADYCVALDSDFVKAGLKTMP